MATSTASLESQLRAVRERQMTYVHPNVIEVLDWEVDSSSARLVMELASGGDLAAVLRDHECLPRAVVEKWAREAARGLVFLHDGGVVHRDITTANLLLSGDPVDGWSVKIGDFGLAYLTGTPRVTELGGPVGTVGYMAPELLSPNGESTAETDLFALGACLQQLADRSEPPLAAATAGAIEALQSADPSSRRTALSHLLDGAGTEIEEPADWSALIVDRSLGVWRHRARRRRARRSTAVVVAASLVVFGLGANRAGWLDEHAAGSPRMLVVDPTSFDDRLSDAVNIGFLAYELAGSRDPALVRFAAGQLLEGDAPCRSFAKCKQLIAEGARVRYIGRTAPSPLYEPGWTSVSQAAHLTSFERPGTGSLPPLWTTVEAGCGVDVEARDERWRMCGADVTGLDDRRTDPELVTRIVDERCAATIVECSAVPDAVRVRGFFAKAEAAAAAQGGSRPFGYGSDRAPSAPLTVGGWVNQCLFAGEGSGWKTGNEDRAVKVVRQAVAEVNGAGGVLGQVVQFDGNEVGGLPAWLGHGSVDVALHLLYPRLCWDGSQYEGEPIFGRRPVLSIVLADDPPILTSDEADYGDEYLEFLGTNGLQQMSPGWLALGQFRRAEDGGPIGSVAGLVRDAARQLEVARTIVIDDRGVRGRPLSNCNGDLPIPFADEEYPRAEGICVAADVESFVNGVSLSSEPRRRSLWVIARNSREEAARAVADLERRPVDLSRVVVITPESFRR